MNMSVGVRAKGAIEMLWIIIKMHEKAPQGGSGTSWEMVCSQPAGKAGDRMLIEMLFFKITMTSTFTSSTVCWGWLYNCDYIRCDEQLCSWEGLWCVWGKMELVVTPVLKLLCKESLFSVLYNIIIFWPKFSMLVLSLPS